MKFRLAKRKMHELQCWWDGGHRYDLVCGDTKVDLFPRHLYAAAFLMSHLRCSRCGREIGK